VDGILQVQATADVDYFLQVSRAAFFEENIARLRACWQPTAGSIFFRVPVSSAFRRCCEV
jgi:hypothetical protein